MLFSSAGILPSPGLVQRTYELSPKVRGGVENPDLKFNEGNKKTLFYY